jgi:hypothetical protein
MSVGTFGIEKEFLHDLLREVRDGQLELPEFQRGWVWPDRHIASLVASISQGYPVGAVMMLRTGGDIRFKQRPVEGATPPARTQVERLILDGQQRLTSLFQALLLDKPVQTQDVRKHPISGWFYVDIRGALDPHTDREETIRFLPSDRVVRNFRGEPSEDLSTPEQEYERHLFPLARVFDPDDWATGFQEHWDYDRDHIKLWNAFNREFIRRFDQYQVPVIELGRDTPRQAVCQVFEKVNTGGVTLTVFELLTATYAADEFDLRHDWEERRRQWSAPEFRILREVSNTDFLQTVTLLATKARRERALQAGDDPDRAPRIGCRRADMLVLQVEEYQRWAPEAVTGLRKAAKFLHQQYFFDTLPALWHPAHPARGRPGHPGPRCRHRRRPTEARPLVLVRSVRGTLCRNHRDPVRPRPARAGRLDQGQPRGAPHGPGGPVRTGPAAHPPNPRQRRLQGHLRAAA